MERTQRTLVLLRHAKSAWPEGIPDPRRPLAPRGRRDAPEAGRWLRDHVPQIDLVVCSPALRARETCELVVAELGNTPATRYDEDVYAAPEEALLDVVRDLPPSATAVLIIGHNPGIEDLVALLSRTASPMRTASIAVLTGRGDWNDALEWAELTESATPRGAKKS